MYLDVNLFWSIVHVLAHYLRSVYAHTCNDTVWAPPIFFYVLFTFCIHFDPIRYGYFGVNFEQIVRDFLENIF